LSKDLTLGVLTWLRLVRFTNRGHQMTNEFLKRFGLTTAQFDVLAQIRAYQPLNQLELVKKVTVTEGGISRMLARLEKEGYIVRQREWTTNTIRLTPKGEAVMDRAYPAQAAFQTSFFDEVLSKEELQLLCSLVTRLEEHSSTKPLPPVDEDDTASRER